MTTAGIVVATLYALWVSYLAIMNLDRARREKRLPMPARILGAPLLVFGFALDAAVNLVLGTVLLADWPREWTLTKRLSRLIAGPGWRSVVANWICTRLLDAFDPSGKHCRNEGLL